MADKMLNFRCPDELLEAIDTLGRKLYPAANPNGCDRSKTLKDVIRAGIQALTDGSVVLPDQVRQSDKNVRQAGIEEERVRAIIEEVLQSSHSVLQPSLDVVQPAASNLDEMIEVKIQQRLPELQQYIDTRIENCIERQLTEILRESSHLKENAESFRQVAGLEQQVQDPTQHLSGLDAECNQLHERIGENRHEGKSLRTQLAQQQSEAIATLADWKPSPVLAELAASAEPTTDDWADPTPASSALEAGLTTRQLAERLKIHKSNVSRNQNKGDAHFQAWSQGKDPDKVAWKFNGKQAKYFPVYKR